MKFDKETAIAVIICIIFVVGWLPFCRMMGWVSEKPARPVTPIADTVQVPAKTVENIKSDSKHPAALPQESASAEILTDIALQELRNDFFVVSIDPVKGEIADVLFEKHYKHNHKDKIMLKGSLPERSGIMSISSAQPWKVKAIVENRLDGLSGYLLVRRIAIADQEILLKQEWKISGNYSLDYKVEFLNPGTEPVNIEMLKVGSGTLMPFSLQSGDMVRGETLTLELMTEDETVKSIAVNASETKFNYKPELPVKWSALVNRYFMTILLAESVPFTSIEQYREKRIPTTPEEKKLIGENFMSKIFGGSNHYYEADTAGVYKQITIPSGQSKILKFKSYLGPKISTEVNAFDPSVSYTMRLMSWRPMNALAKLMLWSLMELKSFCGSFGWAIIMLTIIVRLLVWPFTHKANVSMKKMQSFQPEIKEIRNKYKDNPQLMNTKMMELYKREKINPMRGCLPLLLQLPIFMALYFSLDAVVELRHVPFWWAKDLSQPDTIFEIFGFAVNPLVLMMTGLMILQQKLMPQSGDPMQAKMMMFMPVIMLLILYNLPSGLTLYWTVSQIFSILQMLLTQKLTQNTKTDNNGKLANTQRK